MSRYAPLIPKPVRVVPPQRKVGGLSAPGPVPRMRDASARWAELQRFREAFLFRTSGPRADQPIQRAVEVSQPGDALEQQADRVAERVMGTPAPPPSLQRVPEPSSGVSPTRGHLRPATRSGASPVTGARRPPEAFRSDCGRRPPRIIQQNKARWTDRHPWLVCAW